MHLTTSWAEALLFMLSLGKINTKHDASVRFYAKITFIAEPLI